jgi:hypothetical protein
VIGSSLYPQAITVCDVFEHVKAVDVVYGLKPSLVSKADVVRRLSRPATRGADWVKVAAIFLNDINPRVRSAADHGLRTQRNHVYPVIDYTVQSYELLQMLNELPQPEPLFES